MSRIKTRNELLDEKRAACAPGERCCTNCLLTQPEVDFHRNGKEDMKTCNACAVQSAQARKVRLGRTFEGGLEFKTCMQCGKTLPIEAFRHGEINYKYCVECRRANSAKGGMKNAQKAIPAKTLYPGWDRMHFDDGPANSTSTNPFPYEEKAYVA